MIVGGIDLVQAQIMVGGIDLVHRLGVTKRELLPITTENFPEVGSTTDNVPSENFFLLSSVLASDLSSWHL